MWLVDLLKCATTCAQKGIPVSYIYCVLQIQRAPGDITSILNEKNCDVPFCYESLDKVFFFSPPVALLPNVGHGLLILEVSR